MTYTEFAAICVTWFLGGIAAGITIFDDSFFQKATADVFLQIILSGVCIWVVGSFTYAQGLPAIFPVGLAVTGVALGVLIIRWGSFGEVDAVFCSIKSMHIASAYAIIGLLLGFGLRIRAGIGPYAFS